MKQKSKWNLSATISKTILKERGRKVNCHKYRSQFLTQLRVWLAKVGMYVLDNDIPWHDWRAWHTWWWIIHACETIDGKLKYLLSLLGCMWWCLKRVRFWDLLKKVKLNWKKKKSVIVFMHLTEWRFCPF